MRKIIALILLLLGISACTPQGGPQDDDNPENEIPQTQPVPEFETSYEAVVNMGVGWNLGNTLESVWTGDTDGRDWRRWETGWGQSVTTPELLMMISDAGFGAVRVPVSWGVHMDADGKVYDEWMDRVEEVVGYVLDAGMYCIINVHHDTGADEELAWLVASPSGYAREKDRYEGLWKQIAERFRDYDHRLLFESFNEMLDERRSWCFATFNGGYDEEASAGAYKAINDYAQSFVDVVRATGGNNAVRNLVVNTYGACNGAGDWNPHLKDPIRYMKMPADKVEDHVIFQVHSYPLIDDMAAMNKDVDKMLDGLQTYLEPLGGPVIVGEWGSFSENPPLEDYCTYARYFVSEAKKRGIGTFHWMGISDGFFRSIPCFSDPEIAEAVLKGYHGDGFVPVLPVLENFDFDYKITYRDLWAEANLCSQTLYLSEYKGIAFELEQTPAEGLLHVKVYGEEDGREQFTGFSKASACVIFDPSVLGSKVNRVTLQVTKEGGYQIRLKRVALVRQDDTQEECLPSVFWGCDIELIVL